MLDVLLGLALNALGVAVNLALPTTPETGSIMVMGVTLNTLNGF